MFLGQAGFKFEFNGINLFIDPYLSDYVEKMEGPALKRMRAAPLQSSKIIDADFLLITHIHMDHCDPETIMPILSASPQAKIIAPHGVIAFLVQQGMSAERGISVSENTIHISNELSVTSIPAAHPTIQYDDNGHLECVGFIINYQGRKIFHSGDTSPDDYIINALRSVAPIDVALLPINEKNFYRDKEGIIGNMSIREAFGMALDMSAKIVVPMHYDMFKNNMVYLDELAVVYREQRPAFELLIEPTELVL